MKYDTTGPVAMGFGMGGWEEAGYTAEHRQEVAERLRLIDSSGGCDGFEGFRDDLERATMFDRVERHDIGILGHIADLIDLPTCTMGHSETMSDDELYPTDVWFCNNCGWFHYAGKPRYCENCGRRVIDVE